LEDVVKQTVDVEVTDAVQGHNNDQANTVVVVPPEKSAFSGDRAEQSDIMGSSKHGHAVEGGQKGKRDRLEVSILPGEEGNASVDGEAQKVSRHTPSHSQAWLMSLLSSFTCVTFISEINKR